MLYQNIINELNSYFQDIADSHNLIVRYDNDLRTTPISGIWYECKIEFDRTEQKEIAPNSYRVIGNLIVEIYYSIKIGISFILRQVDILIAYFTETTVNNFLKFKTPIVQNIGRVEDNFQINIICPFYVDN